MKRKPNNINKKRGKDTEITLHFILNNLTVVAKYVQDEEKKKSNCLSEMTLK